jgi:tight adherence protein C
MLGSHIPLIGSIPGGARRGDDDAGVHRRHDASRICGRISGIAPAQEMAGCLPDALDLLVICTNAGNSLGVSIRRVADELKTICPPLADEFSLTADELKLSGDSTAHFKGLPSASTCPRSAR